MFTAVVSVYTSANWPRVKFYICIIIFFSFDFQLLIGIKDVNDQLVSTTLRALADLVLILGSATVIGGKRAKLFTDGRPMTHENSNSASSSDKIKERDKESPAKSSTHHIFENNELPERLSPDGGEDNMSTTTVEEVEVDNETWSDWESPVGTLM